MRRKFIFPLVAKFIARTSRTVVWAGLLDKSEGERICRTIAELNTRSDEPIWLMFYSGGGDGTPMRDIMHAIDASAAPINGSADIACASAAFYILQRCKRRVARPGTIFLFHGGTLGTVRIDQPDFDAKVAEMRAEHDSWLRSLVERSGKVTYEQVKQWSAEEREFSTEEALEFGFIDEIVTR